MGLENKLTGSLSVQGVEFDKKNWTGMQDLRQGILDYYCSKGISKDVLDKYYYAKDSPLRAA